MMHSSGGWWLVAPAMMLALVVAVGVAVWLTAAGGRRPGEDTPAKPHEDDALAVLRRRFADGEIDLQEFERRVEPLIRHEPRPAGIPRARRQ